MLIKDLIMKGL